MERYAKLYSVGSAIDKDSLRIFPLTRQDKISFRDGMEVSEVTNPEFWERMSKTDRDTIRTIVEYNEEKLNIIKQHLRIK